MKTRLLLGFFSVIFVVVVMNAIGDIFIDVKWQRDVFSVGAAVAAGLILGVLFTNPVVRNIRHLVKVTEEVSRGDLTPTISANSKDEIGALADAFSKMIEQLKDLISSMQANSMEVLNSSKSFNAFSQEMKQAINEIVRAIESVSNGAEKQLNLVEHSSKVMINMAASTNLIAKKAGITARTATNMGRLAKSSSASSANAIKTMEGVSKRSTDSLSLVKQFVKRVREINKITVMIAEIANQTNLLALNASIEAARAGEYGAGFAVVAEEVRKLSESTRGFSENINSIVESIQDEQSQILEHMEKGTGDIRHGTKTVVDIGSSLQTISKGVLDMVKDIQEISVLTSSQTDQAKEMVTAIDEVSRLAVENASATEQTAASTEEQATSIDELSNLAMELEKISEQQQEIVAKFKIS
jgi:methyl-accepting chemotaxis protein